MSNQIKYKARYIYILVLSILIFTGCNGGDNSPATKLSKQKTQILVLSGATEIVNAPTVLRSMKPMEVVGESSSVCLALKANVPLAPLPAFEEAFKEAMHGVVTEISIKIKSGEIIYLSKPTNSWNRHGRVVANDELSACAFIEHVGKNMIGSEIEEVSISSSESLFVQGVYWESTNSSDGLKKS